MTISAYYPDILIKVPPSALLPPGPLSHSGNWVFLPSSSLGMDDIVEYRANSYWPLLYNLMSMEEGVRDKFLGLHNIL